MQNRSPIKISFPVNVGLRKTIEIELRDHTFSETRSRPTNFHLNY